MADTGQPTPGANGAPDAPAPDGPDDYGADAVAEPGAQGGNGEIAPFTGRSDRPVMALNYEAEQGVLAGLLFENEAYDKVADFLRPEHFADAAHGRIYEAIGKLIERGQKANAITLKAFFDHDEALAEVGGAEYLGKLESTMIAAGIVPDYGKLIQDLWMRRELMALGEDLLVEAGRADYHEFASELVDKTAQRVFDLAEGGGGKAAEPLGVYAKTVLVELEAAIARGGGITGISTGFRDLDDLLGGFQPADLIVLAGRPSMGKSACSAAIASSVANEGTPALVFSLEMTIADQTRRIIAERCGISAHAMRKGTVSLDERLRLQETVESVQGLPLYLDDTAALTVRQMHTRARRLKRSKGLGLVVIDHLGFVQPLDRRAQKVHQIEEITHGLRVMAKDLGVPVLLLHQLSRAVEQRDDKRPILADLRDSGAIEQDADVVIFIYRDAYYLARSEPRPGSDQAKYRDRHAKWETRMNAARNKAELIVTKQRNGPVGNVDLFFDERTLRWTDLAQGSMGQGNMV